MEIIIVLVLYFLPMTVAALRKHHDGGAIAVLNLLLGWTVLGWIVSLVWALTAIRSPATAPTAQAVDYTTAEPAEPRATHETSIIQTLLARAYKNAYWLEPVAWLALIGIVLGSVFFIGRFADSGSARQFDPNDRAEYSACSEALTLGSREHDVTGGIALRVTQAREHSNRHVIACDVVDRGTEAPLEFILLAWRDRYGPPGNQTRYAGFEGLDGERLAEGPTYQFLEAQLAAWRVAEADATRGQQWRYSTERSAMTDFQNHFLTVSASGQYRNRFSRTINPTLTIRCMENATSMIVNADEFLGIRDMRLEYRIDSAAMQSRNWLISSDNNAVGLWRGNESIPVLRQIISSGAESLTIRYTPNASSPRTVTFDISGLDRRIMPLREACSW